jgi:mannose-1-phosphate guanylyltransferase
MIWHPIAALAQVPDLKEIIIIGFYEDAVMQDFLKKVRKEFPPLHIT